MRRNNLITIAICSLILLGTAVAQQPYSHPVHGHPPSVTFDPDYGPGHGLSSDLNYNDLTFTDDLPLASSLTAEEKYIISGSESSNLPDGIALRPWTSSVFALLKVYYNQYGSIPNSLTPEIIKSISGFDDIPEAYLSEYLNPLTDQWPMLNAVNPSPGDLYVRILNNQEIAYFANNVTSYYDLFVEQHYYDAAQSCSRPAELTSPVFYMRVYGWHGVLANALVFSWKWSDE